MKKYFQSCCTDFLFARPSFLSGIARTLDMHGDMNQYNISVTGEEADLRGLVCDWLVVQKDFQASWAKIIDQNPKFLDEVVYAISNDPYLLKTVSQLLSEEKLNDSEMARQGA
jgi:hypothetical protein